MAHIETAHEDEERQHWWIQAGRAEDRRKEALHLRENHPGGCKHHAVRLHRSHQASVPQPNWRIALHLFLYQPSCIAVLDDLYLFSPHLWGAERGKGAHLDRLFLQLLLVLCRILFVLYPDRDSHSGGRVVLFRNIRNFHSCWDGCH